MPTLLVKVVCGRRKFGLIGRRLDIAISLVVSPSLLSPRLLVCKADLEMCVAIWWSEAGKDRDRRERGETKVSRLFVSLLAAF